MIGSCLSNQNIDEHDIGGTKRQKEQEHEVFFQQTGFNSFFTFG